MSILRRRRVAAKLKRKTGNGVGNLTPPPKIVYNPYKKKLMIVKKSSPSKKIPQFKFRKQPPQLSDWIGDTMHEHPDPTVTRFLLQNCHGLPLLKDTNYFKSKITQILVNDIHFMALPEINVNCMNSELTQGYKEAFSQLVPDGVFTTTNSPVFEKNHRYQPGGVASGFFGKLVTRYVSQKCDKYGRWHSHEFNGKHQNLRVYTLYRTNYKTDATAGGITAWAQQRLLLQQDGNYLNPRASVVEDFVKEIQTTIEDGISIIVLTDLNEHVDSQETTNGKLLDAGLINLFQERLGDDLPRTYKRGKKAIDHIYMTPNVYPYILKAGMAPFDFCLKSDHRALLFDLNLNAFLDPDINVVTPYNRRRLKATVPARMEKYLAKLSQKWEEHKIEERIQRIEEVLIHTATKDQVEKALNDVDELITGLMRYAEKQCAKTGKSHTLPWSPDLHYSILHVRECTAAVKEALYIEPHQSITEQLAIYQAAEVELQEAKASYKSIKEEAQNHRKKFMDEKIAFYHKKTGKTAGSILKSLKHIEEQQRDSAKIGFALERNQRRGISNILIPAQSEYSENSDQYKSIPAMWERIERASGKDIENWEKITDRGELENMLVEWQKQHFRQAGETPLSTIQWRRRFIDEETQEQILDGTYIVEDELPEECKEILEYIKWNQQTRDKVNHKTTLNEFLQFIQNAKEKSSCSPSGRTYSHYKTLLEKPEFLTTIHRIFSLALEHDIILKRWTQTITTLIPKDEGPIYVHRLRAIHVVEAELQFFSKITYAKKMVQVAEAANAITDEQYGGRKGRRAQSIVLNKILYYAISHQTREEAAFLDDDAKACYDRILPSLAGVESRKWGLTHKATSLTRKIIESQQFKVKTAHGISTKTYQYEENDQTFGVGQGLGWSGAIWMSSSNTICEIMKDKCGGMEFTSPDRTVVIKKRGDLFVDDTALGVTEGSTLENNTVIDQMTKDGQQHAYSLFSEGHRLTLPKCSWYLARYARQGTKHRHQMIHEAPGQIQLREGFDMELKTVKRLEPFNVHKTLGNYISLDGKQTAQLRFLKAKVKEWAKRVRTSGLSGSQRLLAYNGYLVPSLAYRLATSSLTFQQCKELQTLIDPILLHAYGLQRNLPKIVLFSTTSKAGLGITHVYHLQGLEKIKLFLMHLRRNDTTGNLLHIAMENIKLELGIDEFFMTLDYYSYCHFTTANWVTHLWQYLCDCNATITPTKVKKYKYPRESDRFFMQLIYASSLSIHEKEIINQIRIKLRILTLSDIVEVGSSSSILSPIWKAKAVRESTWKWPIVLDFPDTWIATWKDALINIIEPHLNNNPLGRWIVDSHQTWKYKASENGQYIQVDDCIYERFTTTRQSKFIPSSVNAQCLYPADVTEENGEILLLSWMTSPQNNTIPSEHTEESPEWMKQNWGVEITMETQQKIAKCLADETLMAVSDGSVNKNKAGQAWTLVNQDTEETLIQGVSMVDGEGPELCSTRAEMFGLLASLTCAQMAAKNFNVTGGSMTMYTDSTSSIRKSLRNRVISTKDILKRDNDIEHEIRARLQQIPFKVKIIHVKGHQDRDNEIEELDLQAQLNCKMDDIVSTHVTNSTTAQKQYPILPLQRFIICIAGDITPNLIHQKLIDHFNDEAWATYISKRLGITHTNICKVDWMPMKTALQTPKLKGSYIKNFHKELNTMDRCKLWKTSDTSKCPLCHKKKETWQHVLQCKNEHAKRARNEARLKVSEELTKLQTHISIKKLFLHILDRWTEKKKPKRPTFADPDPIEEKIITIFDAQKAIGWDAFIKGILSSEWKTLQQADYDGQHAERMSGDRWSKKMVSSLFDYNHTVWKNRCEIVHLENKETLEQRKRKQLKNLRDRLVKKPWKIRQSDRHLLHRTDDFFKTGNIQAIDLWEQLIFVAMEQKGNDTTSNDIRQYGTIQHRQLNPAQVSSPPQLRPSQTIGKYRQLKLHRLPTSTDTTPKRTVLSSQLRAKQLEIESFMDQGKRRKKQSPTNSTCKPPRKQLHLRDFFVINNSLTRGHRRMARSPLVGATRKINNLIN